MFKTLSNVPWGLSEDETETITQFNQNAQQALIDARRRYPRATLHHKTINRAIITQEPAPNSPLFASLAVIY